MTASAHHSFRDITARIDTHEAERYADDFHAGLDVAPEDRMGPPPPRKFVKRLLIGVVLGGLGVGYIWYDRPVDWPKWWAEAQGIVSPLLEKIAQSSLVQAPTTPSRHPTVPSTGETVREAVSQSAETQSVTTEMAEAAKPPLDADVSPTVDELPVKIVTAAPLVKEPDPPSPLARKSGAADPNQARAAAVGLSPDLSSVLLARLSEGDYRNAGVAIRKALAETPDDTVLYWPQTVKRGVAQFQIHFVPGAEPNCRRYVVTIAKDGWATTSLPMDKCGVVARAATVRE